MTFCMKLFQLVWLLLTAAPFFHIQTCEKLCVPNLCSSIGGRVFGRPALHQKQDTLNSDSIVPVFSVSACKTCPPLLCGMLADIYVCMSAVVEVGIFYYEMASAITGPGRILKYLGSAPSAGIFFGHHIVYNRSILPGRGIYS